MTPTLMLTFRGEKSASSAHHESRGATGSAGLRATPAPLHPLHGMYVIASFFFYFYLFWSCYIPGGMDRRVACRVQIAKNSQVFAGLLISAV
jgi:hypothetical protein